MSYATPSFGRFATGNENGTDVLPDPARPQWVVLWSDFATTNAIETDLVQEAKARPPHQVFVQDSVSVRVYSLTPTGRQ